MLALDRTVDVTAQLFAAFPSSAFPAKLDRSKLIQLLSEPLLVKVLCHACSILGTSSCIRSYSSLTTEEQRMSLLLGLR